MGNAGKAKTRDHDDLRANRNQPSLPCSRDNPTITQKRQHHKIHRQQESDQVPHDPARLRRALCGRNPFRGALRQNEDQKSKEEPAAPEDRTQQQSRAKNDVREISDHSLRRRRGEHPESGHEYGDQHHQAAGQGDALERSQELGPEARRRIPHDRNWGALPHDFLSGDCGGKARFLTR